MRRRAGVRREPAETRGELVANGRVRRRRKGVAGVVVERQEQLDEVNVASDRYAGGGTLEETLVPAQARRKGAMPNDGASPAR